jgi:hypothetical protein
MIGAYFRRQPMCKPCFAVYDEVQTKINPDQGKSVLGIKTSGSSAPTKKGFTFLQDNDEP